MAGLELLSDEGYRLDGRKPFEQRKIACRLGVFTQADGSAYIEQGNAKVLAAVYGPHEPRGSRSRSFHDRVLVNCQFSMATFSTLERKRRPRGDKKSQEMTLHIQQAFEASILTQLYPRSQIDIFVEVLQSDGGTLSVCINAATLALIDAGIALKDYVCACSVGFVDGVPLVDISHLEESLRGPELTVAVLPKSQQMVLLEMTSRVHVDNLQKMLDAAVKGCIDVHAILDSQVKEHTAQVGSCIGWE
ncbi:exosome complex component RRP41 [Dermacentor andersoni]|uniref:Exosome complex component RRP41 n=2 Tax=Rhipicephalinae TaxID=426437 RepID=L7LXK9_RHIPC|nr:exosome complex component RRP41 [Dermacentor silvarum]XP_050049441.1 exosome complex component RRP41-like [Dermacentor andersoni]